jgi:hypothetical protein
MKTGYNNGQELDFSAIAELALSHVDTLLDEILPGGQCKGREYVTLNPTRQDNTPGSFKVNLTTGTWSDFATWLHREGVSLDVLRPLLGHSNRSTTDRYTTYNRMECGKALSLLPQIRRKQA